jgi:hypothetical protein
MVFPQSIVMKCDTNSIYASHRQSFSLTFPYGHFLERLCIIDATLIVLSVLEPAMSTNMRRRLARALLLIM